MMKDLPGPLPLTADEMPIEPPHDDPTDPEIEHLRYVDADGATFIIASENGCVSIQVSGGHDSYDDGEGCEGCDDCIETVALYACDIPTIIEGLQLALQHAALTGEYGKAGTIEGDIVEQRAEQQAVVMEKGLSRVAEGLVRHEQRGQLCNMETGEHVIPHRGCILR
ncbi:hypothetical protein FDH48_gp44 [Arthrobacter phage Jawnski]|uniref:Uncharacterized protein n=1 Tax=Arthrobacter phage Jawnski TaxID=1772327 RepID=A0A0U4B3Q2_9CAUD|nr:hypothetical protein FDH48_gp44 [Arthrobacter phage Jawnski]ALY09373.1 hypothetical protein JAWNSKI_44 [Arthrobacter phage Jawnski]